MHVEGLRQHSHKSAVPRNHSRGIHLSNSSNQFHPKTISGDRDENQGVPQHVIPGGNVGHIEHKTSATGAAHLTITEREAERIDCYVRHIRQLRVRVNMYFWPLPLR